jgi:glyoxylate reductase
MKVFITRSLPDAATKLLKDNGIKVSVYKKDNPIPRKVLEKNIQNVDALISLLTDKIDSSLIDKMDNCKIIANYAVGYNNIDVEYAKKKNIIVTNTPDVLTDAAADLTMALVLACARQIIAADKFMRKKKFTGWKPKLFLGVEFKNKTFGILGSGRIGSAVAVRANAFGAKIIYYSLEQNIEMEEKTGAVKVELDELLKQSDIVSLHLPLTDKTYHLLNKEKLALLKETAILINTARGEIIDEREIIKLLKKKKIFAAGLDVYENEFKVNEKLLSLDNVVLLPHIGSATFDTRTNMALLAAKNVIAVLKSEKPITPVG